MVKQLRGTELRYVLAVALANCGRMTVAELIAELTRQGFGVDGRASKVISDALRWEVGIDRAVRFGRGKYAPGYMPRSTEHRIRRRVAALKEEAFREYLADYQTEHLTDTA